MKDYLPNYGELIWLLNRLEKRCDYLNTSFVMRRGKQQQNGVNTAAINKWNEKAVKVSRLKTALRELGPSDYASLIKGVVFEDRDEEGAE